MDQANSLPCHGVHQLFGGTYVAGVKIFGAQGFGDARQVYDSIGAAQCLGDARTALQIAVDGLYAGRQHTRHTGAADQSAYGLTIRNELFQQVRTDEAGTASDQDHYCSVLRKATSPK